jgi:cysteine-rich repeat protein
MRKKTHSVAMALVTGVAVCSPVLSSSSCSGNGSSNTPADAGSDVTVLSVGKCGNGVVNLNEQCDLGADGGPGCDKHCNFFCIPDTLNGNALCDDHNPCNGVETCAGEHNEAGVPPHTCASGTPLADNTPCGNGSVCRTQSSDGTHVCAGAAVCGNTMTEGTEECDQGANNGAGMGCGKDCRWTCVTTDPARNCASTNPCVGQGTCDATMHVCTPGPAAADGTSCGTNQICKSGSCISARCGDGQVESGEDCDFGPGNGLGAGCEPNCKFSCTLAPADNCQTPDPCAGTNTCTAFMGVNGGAGQKCTVGPPPATGTACLNGGTCNAGHLCAGQPSCGNSTRDTGEQCDWGSANAHGAGCEPDCTFSCGQTSLFPNACPGLDPCSAMPQVCQTLAGPTGNDGQKCQAGTALAACATCGSGNVNLCINHICTANSCGDGCVAGSEQCDPPDGRTCDPTCQRVVCGDGKIGGNEQCDDGNTTNLDGCDSRCFFEQLQRSTQLVYMTTTDSYCTTNALAVNPGGAITAPGLSVVQAQNANDIATGITSVIFKFMGTGGQPADLTGTTGSVVLGSLAGIPDFADAGTAYNGNSDVDWWYAVDPTMVDTSRNPLTTLSGTFSGKTLNAGPGRITIKVDLSGSPARLDLWSAKLRVAIGADSTPMVATGGMPPGHVASENLAPNLSTFETAGVGGSGPTGELCGNISAASLAGVVTPSTIAIGGSQACSENYGPTTSMLDVLVQGCTVTGTVIISATQPDQRDTTVTFPSGTKAPYVLSASGSSHVIDTCKDSSSSPQTVPVVTCKNAYAYSAAFMFQTDRVIVR